MKSITLKIFEHIFLQLLQGNWTMMTQYTNVWGNKKGQTFSRILTHSNIWIQYVDGDGHGQIYWPRNVACEHALLCGCYLFHLGFLL